jgi:hypothetical protein
MPAWYRRCRQFLTSDIHPEIIIVQIRVLHCHVMRVATKDLEGLAKTACICWTDSISNQCNWAREMVAETVEGCNPR